MNNGWCRSTWSQVLDKRQLGVPQVTTLSLVFWRIDQHLLLPPLSFLFYCLQRQIDGVPFSGIKLNRWFFSLNEDDDPLNWCAPQTGDWPLQIASFSLFAFHIFGLKFLKFNGFCQGYDAGFNSPWQGARRYCFRQCRRKAIRIVSLRRSCVLFQEVCSALLVTRDDETNPWKKEKDEDHAPVACLPNLTVTASCQSPSYPYPSRLRSSRQYLGLTALNTAPTLYCHFLPSEKYGRNTMRGKSFRFGGGSNLFFPFFVVARRQLTRNTQTLERRKKGNGPYFRTILIFPIISNPLLCQLFEKKELFGWFSSFWPVSFISFFPVKLKRWRKNKYFVYMIFWNKNYLVDRIECSMRLVFE